MDNLFYTDVTVQHNNSKTTISVKWTNVYDPYLTEENVINGCMLLINSFKKYFSTVKNIDLSKMKDWSVDGFYIDDKHAEVKYNNDKMLLFVDNYQIEE